MQRNMEGDRTMSEQDVVCTILEECRQVHQARERVHGYDEHFEDAAKLTALLIGRCFDAYEVTACALAMKLVRYANQVNRTSVRSVTSPSTTKDTIIDAINYIALTERERIKGVNKERTTTTPKAAPRPGDRSSGHTDLSGIKPYVPQSSSAQGATPENTSVPQVP